MLWGFAVIIALLGILMVVERKYPARPLKHVPGWWKNVLLINFFQLICVITAAFSWEVWFQRPSRMNLSRFLSPGMGGFLAYLINTHFFYFWHKWRHESLLLWRTCHQLHHSASRIETITSFYKHPFEIV